MRIRRGVSPGQRINRQRHEYGNGGKSEPVETALNGIFPLFLHEQAQQDGKNADRHIDIENQMPALFDQETAQQRTERNRSGGSHRPKTESHPALPGRELTRDDGQSERLDHAAANSL